MVGSVLESLHREGGGMVGSLLATGVIGLILANLLTRQQTTSHNVVTENWFQVVCEHIFHSSTHTQTHKHTHIHYHSLLSFT